MKKLDGDHIDALYNIYDRWYHEMEAESAWSGHEYAIDYLRDISKEVIDTLSDMKDSGCSECESHKYDIESGLFKFKPEVFSEALNTVYDNFDDSDVRDCMADSLDETFKTRLKVSIDILDDVYKEATGKSFDEKMCEDQMTYRDQLEDKYSETISNAESLDPKGLALTEELPFE